MFYFNRDLIMRAALRHTLPTIVSSKEYVDAGGLLSFVPDSAEIDRIFAYFVDTILRGAKPADLPVQQPSKFWLTINLKDRKGTWPDDPTVNVAARARSDPMIGLSR